MSIGTTVRKRSLQDPADPVAPTRPRWMNLTWLSHAARKTEGWRAERQRASIHGAAYVVLILGALVWTSCKSGPTTPTPVAARSLTLVAISGSTSFTGPGQTSQLSAVANYSDATTENVTATAVWQTSNASVATVTGGGLLTAQGAGSADVTATYQGQTGRASVTVAAAPCSVSLSETTVTFERAGGTRSVSIQASTSSCAWQAASNASWLRITSGGGAAGNGVVSYEVEPYTGTSTREGVITISGPALTAEQRLTVRQTSDPPSQCGFPFCYTVNPTDRVVSSAGGTFSFVMTSVSSTGEPGTWEVYSVPPWVTITGGRTATGTGTVTYFVQSNSSTLGREGDIVVGGISRQFPPAAHRVIQRGR